MKIQSLHYYPVKSLAGISCDQFKLDTKGPEYDRRYMLVNAAGQFITQRQFGQLALLTLHLTDSGFRVTQPSGEAITIPFIGEQRKRVRSKIWSDEIELFEQPQVQQGPAQYLTVGIDQNYLEYYRHLYQSPHYKHHRYSLHLLNLPMLYQN